MASSFDLHVDRMTQYQYEAEFGGQDDPYEATMAELRAEHARAWPVDPFAGDPPDDDDVPDSDIPDSDVDDEPDHENDSDVDNDDSDIPF